MLEKYIKAARRETKADLVLKNATYLDVFSGKVRKGDIAIVGDKIVGMGDSLNICYTKRWAASVN